MKTVPPPEVSCDTRTFHIGGRADRGGCVALHVPGSATSMSQEAGSEVKAVPLPEPSYGMRTFRGTGQTLHSHDVKQSTHAHKNPQRGAAGQPHNNDVLVHSDAALAEAEGAHTDQKSMYANKAGRRE